MPRRVAQTEDANTLAAYLREISRLPRLTVEEERELGARIRHDRDEAAISRLVESHLRFVVQCAKRYRGCGVPILDLIHEGNLGLMEAARRFDPSRGVTFIACAGWWVRQAIVLMLPDEARAVCLPSTPPVDLDDAIRVFALDPARSRDEASTGPRRTAGARQSAPRRVPAASASRWPAKLHSLLN